MDRYPPPEQHEPRRVGGFRVAYRSYRLLPLGWQLIIGLLVVLLLGTASGVQSGGFATDEALTSARAAHAKASAAERRLRASVEDLEDANSRLREQLASAQLRAGNAADDARRVSDLDQRVRRLSTRVAGLRAENKSARKRAKTAERRLADTEAELRDTKAALASAADVAAEEPETEPQPAVGGGNDAGCHTSYSGDCLPLSAVDVDCAGGSGDGPVYSGPVQIIGPDTYGLDADGDGYACE